MPIIQGDEKPWLPVLGRGFRRFFNRPRGL